MMRYYILLLSVFFAQSLSAQNIENYEYATDQCVYYYLQEKNKSWDDLKNVFFDIITTDQIVDGSISSEKKFKSFVVRVAEGREIIPTTKSQNLYESLAQTETGAGESNDFEPLHTCFNNYWEQSKQFIEANEDQTYKQVYELTQRLSKFENQSVRSIADEMQNILNPEDYNRDLYQKVIFFAVFIPAIAPKQEEVLQEFEVEEDNSEVFVVVETMPRFPGGNTGLKRFVATNLEYPPLALKNKITGKVYVKFVVSKEGYAKNPEVVRGVHPLLDEAAIKLVEKMPRWKPGKQRGKNVDVFYTIPVNFYVN